MDRDHRKKGLLSPGIIGEIRQSLGSHCVWIVNVGENLSVRPKLIH